MELSREILTGVSMNQTEKICHGDTSIWNFVFVDDRIAACSILNKLILVLVCGI